MSGATALRANRALRQGSGQRLGQGLGARAVLQARRLDRWLWCLPLITATLASKLAIPPFGERGLSIATPLICLAVLLGAATGRLVFDRHRLLGYLLLLALLWAFQLFDGEFSPLSMLLLTLLHLPYVLQLKRRPDPAQVLGWFQALALLIGALGLLQYSIQFAVGPQFAFPIENFFPAAFRVSAFNMQGNLAYGSEVYRTNGVFMLEPSFFSQLMALGIVVEIITRRRVWAMLLLASSMLLSYSGTGVALLGASLLFLAIGHGRWDLLMSLAVGALLLVGMAGFVGNVPYVSVFLARAGEFSSQGSSGFARFVGGFYVFDQFLWGHLREALIGYGAGTFQTYSLRSPYPAAGMAIFKIVFEFGLIGAIAYFGFLYDCVARSSAPAVLRFAVGLTFLLSGIYIPFAHALALSLLIWTAPPHATSSRA